VLIGNSACLAVVCNDLTYVNHSDTPTLRKFLISVRIKIVHVAGAVNSPFEDAAAGPDECWQLTVFNR